MNGLRNLLLAMALAGATEGGSLSGPVRILERDGRVRPGLRDAVALLEPVRPGPWPAPSSPVVIRTVGKRFLPRVAITSPGTEVRFPNLDPILHNVFSVTPGDAFDTGHYLPGDAPSVRLRNPGLVKLYCNIHHQMNAYVWVVTTPFAQILDGRRRLHFRQVPPGDYRLRLWHPETGDRQWPVRIGPGTTRGEWTLAVSLPAVEPHKNKFGHDYPPPGEEREYERLP